MEGWYTEYHTPHVGISMKIKEHLYKGNSKYQKIDVIYNETYGRVLILDDLIMLTDKDEFVYHEMMTHMPLLTHPEPKRVLVVGGGDGGVIREICKHPSVEHVDQAEIDGEVIEISKRFFPQIACEYDNPKVHVHVTDGFKWVLDHPGEYDVIIVDSTDPIGPGKILFSDEFYEGIYRSLKTDGIMVAQIGCPFYSPDHVRDTFRKLHRIFPIARPYMVHVPTYLDGFYTLGFCSRKYDALSDFSLERFNDLNLGCKYLNPEVQKGVFLLPEYVAVLVRN